MDWKWMIERGGRVTFTVISAPSSPHSLPPHPHPFPALLLLLQTRRRIQWHWKLALYRGFFGADRIRAISLNLAVKETHLAEINSGGFFFFCFPVSSHSFAGRHTVHLECLKVLCCFPEFDEKDIGENTSWQRLPKCVGDAQRVTHSNSPKKKNPKWVSHEKYLCVLNFLVSTRKVFLISCV